MNDRDWEDYLTGNPCSASPMVNYANSLRRDAEESNRRRLEEGSRAMAQSHSRRAASSSRASSGASSGSDWGLEELLGVAAACSTMYGMYKSAVAVEWYWWLVVFFVVYAAVTAFFHWATWLTNLLRWGIVIALLLVVAMGLGIIKLPAASPDNADNAAITQPSEGPTSAPFFAMPGE